MTQHNMAYDSMYIGEFNPLYRCNYSTGMKGNPTSGGSIEVRTQKIHAGAVVVEYEACDGHLTTEWHAFPTNLRKTIVRFVSV